MTGFVTGFQFIQPHTQHGIPSAPQNACARCSLMRARNGNGHIARPSSKRARIATARAALVTGCDAKQRCHGPFNCQYSFCIKVYIFYIVTDDASI